MPQNPPGFNVQLNIFYFVNIWSFANIPITQSHDFHHPQKIPHTHMHTAHFLAALLRYNSHTIHPLRVSSSVLLIYEELYDHHHNQFKNISLTPPLRNPEPLNCHLPSPIPSQGQATILASRQMQMEAKGGKGSRNEGSPTVQCSAGTRRCGRIEKQMRDLATRGSPVTFSMAICTQW